jgi:hypothetical protein
MFKKWLAQEELRWKILWKSKYSYLFLFVIFAVTHAWTVANL